MTEKMTVLFIEQTGHVLGALTHVADPTAELSPSVLASGGLLVRGFPGKQQFEVPPEWLKTLNVDLNEAVLLNPRAFYVDETQKSALPVASAPISSVVLDSTKVTVTPISATVAVTTLTKVWVQVAGGTLTEPRVAKGELKIGDKKLELSIETLDPGPYSVLTLAVNYAPKISTRTV